MVVANFEMNCSDSLSNLLPLIENEDLLYGELIVLGYNGSGGGASAAFNGSPRQSVSRYVLKKRPTANGISRKQCHSVRNPQQSKAVTSRHVHSVSYTVSKTETMVVEYDHDPRTDMFQVGRSSEPQIDFVVVDTWLGLARNADAQKKQAKLESTISRYACRLVVEREYPYPLRLFAAGFDSSNNIFLGEKATKWRTDDGGFDGLTTNGVLILHPKMDNLDSDDGGSYVWREVSVGGNVYALRESRSASERGSLVEEENNTVLDGGLIDLCGATLLWRSAKGLKQAPTRAQLESRVDELNAGRPQCPVNLNTLVIPRGRQTAVRLSRDRLPYAYPQCGHVQGRHAWGHQDGPSATHECPLCNAKSKSLIQLSMGMESAFHLDSERPNYALNPCGHMASERTVRYWSRIPLPHGSSSFLPVCPFCCTPLEQTLPYVKLIFQDHCD